MTSKQSQPNKPDTLPEPIVPIDFSSYRDSETGKPLPPPPPPARENPGGYSPYSDEDIRRINLETNTIARMVLFIIPAAVGVIFGIGMALGREVLWGGLGLSAVMEYVNILYFVFKRRGQRVVK